MKSTIHLLALIVCVSGSPAFAQDPSSDDLALSPRSAPRGNADTSRAKLAAEFAPILLQRVNEGSADIDVPTDPFRPGASNVLYDVKESPTHTYISYFVYHAADEKRIGVGSHANDLEGVTIAVRKSRGGEPAQAVAAITLAHNQFLAHDLTGGDQLMEGGRLVLQIEAGAHGIRTVSAKKKGGPGKLRGLLNVRKQVEDRALAKRTDRTVRYDPAAAGGERTYGLRLLTAPELARLTAKFKDTAGNGARTPEQWADGDRVQPGELYRDPEAVFLRLVFRGGV